MHRPLVILQVEDTPSDVSITAYALETGDVPHEMHVVSDGREAIDFLQRGGPYSSAPRPDIILLDLEMPGLNGEKVLEFIKGNADLKSIPVIIFSTYDSLEKKIHAYDLHANSYVLKPNDMNAFVKKVQGIADYWSNISESLAVQN
jgi:CheY-like chemotaxis protein